MSATTSTDHLAVPLRPGYAWGRRVDWRHTSAGTAGCSGAAAQLRLVYRPAGS
jgi:hypothetical protein